MEKLERRVGSLEEEQPLPSRRITLRAKIVQTYFNERGERCERELAATYDENQPFPEVAPGKLSIRNLWPTEYDAGPYTPRMDGDDGPGGD